MSDLNDIKLIKKVNSNHEKKILVIGVFHGDEFQGEFFINSFLESDNPPLKNTVFYIPRLNKNTSRKNLTGVDLNRNFPTKNWVKNEPESDYFSGVRPNSEPETQFLVKLIDENKFDAIITIHSPYKVVNFDGPAQELAETVSKILGYKVTSDIGYPTPGSFGTYCGKERNIPTLTIEIDEEDDINLLNKKFERLFLYLENEY